MQPGSALENANASGLGGERRRRADWNCLCDFIEEGTQEEEEEEEEDSAGFLHLCGSEVGG